MKHSKALFSLFWLYLFRECLLGEVFPLMGQFSLGSTLRVQINPSITGENHFKDILTQAYITIHISSTWPTSQVTLAWHQFWTQQTKALGSSPACRTGQPTPAPSFIPNAPGASQFSSSAHQIAHQLWQIQTTDKTQLCAVQEGAADLRTGMTESPGITKGDVNEDLSTMKAPVDLQI